MTPGVFAEWSAGMDSVGYDIRAITPTEQSTKWYVEVWAPRDIYTKPADIGNWYGWKATSWSTRPEKNGVLIQAVVEHL